MSLNVQLALRRVTSSPTVDDHAFPLCQASVALSDELCAVFISNGILLTRAAVESLGWTTLALWDAVADETTTTRLRIRPHPIAGIEIATATGAALSWLAHPHTFWLLNTRLEQVLGGPIMYFAPTINILVATPLSATSLKRLHNWAIHTYNSAGTAGLTAGGLVYTRGFPLSINKQFAHAR